MSEQVDSDDTSQEDIGQSQVQDVSGAALAQNATHSLDMKELVEAALADPAASEELRRRFQSEKDKGVEAAKREAREAKSMAEQLAEYLGVDDPEQVKNATRNLVLDRIVQRELGQADSGESVSEQTAPETLSRASSLDLTKAFESAGWKPDEILREDWEFASSFKDEVALKNALLGRRVQSTKAKASSPASVASQSGTKSSVGGDMNDLQRRKDEILSNSQLALSFEGQNELKEIALQMEELEK